MPNLLSIDGGGVLGIGSLLALKMLEKEVGKSCHELFDGFAGTSVGSIIAASLASGRSAEETYYIFKKDVHKIFKKRPWYHRVNPFKAKYDSNNLQEVFEHRFGKLMFSDIPKPLYIPVSDFKTKRSIILDKDTVDFNIATAIRMSCSAPTYFDPYLDRYADGGLQINNPSMVLATGYSRHFRKDLDNLDLLSISSAGYSTTPIKVKNDTAALFWAGPLIDFCLQSNRTEIDFYCRYSGFKSYVRLEPVFNKKWEMDDVNAMDAYEDAWRHFLGEENPLSLWVSALKKEVSKVPEPTPLRIDHL